MSIAQTLTQYENARKQIAEAFDCQSLWYNVIILTDEIWTDYGDEYYTIEYTLEEFEEKDGGEKEFQYSFDVYGTSKWQTSEYVMFCGDNGEGDRDLYLFSKTNYVTSIEDIEDIETEDTEEGE